jgi:hypothetical protein
MEFFEKIYNESNDPSEFLHKINNYYIMFRKKFTNSDMENSFFLLSKKIFKKEDYSLYEWSSFSYYISNVYNVSKKKLVADYLKNIFETKEKALIFFKNIVIEIKNYRNNVRKYVKDDIFFLMSHFATFSSNDLGVFRTACEILEEEL